MKALCFDLIEVPEATLRPNSWFLAHFLMSSFSPWEDDFQELVGKASEGEWRLVVTACGMGFGFPFQKGKQ